MDYTEWLALSKGPTPAGGDSETHNSNSDSLPWLPLKLQESKGEHVWNILSLQIQESKVTGGVLRMMRIEIGGEM